MTHRLFTHAMWKVKAGRVDEFIEAWNDLAAVLGGLPAKPVSGTLLQSESDETLFYSFGPWRSREDLAAMRADARAQDRFARLRELCDEATPSTYRVIRHIDVESGG